MDILNKKGKEIAEMPISLLQEKHSEAVNNELLQFKTSMANLNIIDESFISIKNAGNESNIKIGQNAYSDILQIGLFTPKMKNTFQKILKDKNKTIDLLNKFKKELVLNQGDIPVTLVGNASTKTITNIIPDKKGHEIITNSDFLNFVYSMVNKYDLKIIDFNVNKNGTLSINTITNDHDPIVIDSLNPDFGIPENETFHRGLHFSSSIYDYKIVPTTVRIFCSNQITLSQVADTISFNNLKLTGKAKLEKEFLKLENNNFVPESFIKQVKRAFETPSSLREFEHVANAMKSYSTLEDKDLDTYINYTEIKNTFEEYQSKKKILLNSSMKSQIPTDKTVWELINAMTYMASNAPDRVLFGNQRDVLGLKSGEILRGDSKNGLFDLQLKFDSPFVKKWY